MSKFAFCICFTVHYILCICEHDNVGAIFSIILVVSCVWAGQWSHEPMEQITYGTYEHKVFWLFASINMHLGVAFLAQDPVHY